MLTHKHKQIVLILACVALTIYLYAWGQRKSAINTTQPTAAGMPSRMPATTQAPPPPPNLNFNALIENLQKKLTPAQLQPIKQLETQLEQASPKQRAQILQQLATLWQKATYPEVAAYIYKRIAQADSTQPNWEKAAKELSIAFKMSEDSTMQAFLAAHAANASKIAWQMDTSNTTNKSLYASTLMEAYFGQPQYVMQGVTILRQILAKDSLHYPSNLMLGKMAMVSGQTDRAIQRLQAATKSNPPDEEAYLYLAEAYAAKNDKENAIKYYEICKNKTKNANFAVQLEQLIKQLKNSPQ